MESLLAGQSYLPAFVERSVHPIRCTVCASLLTLRVMNSEAKACKTLLRGGLRSVAQTLANRLGKL